VFPWYRGKGRLGLTLLKFSFFIRFRHSLPFYDGDGGEEGADCANCQPSHHHHLKFLQKANNQIKIVILDYTQEQRQREMR
jgi:hypothetical protein